MTAPIPNPAQVFGGRTQPKAERKAQKKARRAPQPHLTHRPFADLDTRILASTR